MLKEDKNLFNPVRGQSLNRTNGLKILIATGIYPPDIGGPATYLPQFIDFLESKDCDVKVITFSDSSDNDPKVFRILRKDNVIVRFLKYSFCLWKELKDVDLIYLHDVSLVGLSLLVVNFFRRKKYIIRIGGDNIWEQAYQRGLTKEKCFDFHSQKLPSLGLKFKKFILKIIAKNSEKIIVPSFFLKKVIKVYGIPDNKIEVVNNAVDLDIKDNKNEFYSRIENYKKEGDKIFVSGGRLISLKKFDLLIKVFKNIKNGKLLIIGSGPEKNNLVKLIQDSNLSEKIFTIEKMDRGELLNIFSLMDVFILLSIGDAFSFITLEALLSGSKVVLAREGALPEIFGEFEHQGVEFVDLNDENYIVNLLNNLDRVNRIDESGIKTIKNKYNYERHLEDVYKIILNIIR